MLTIYSIGDPWYLGKVMDAIAMISGHNAGFVGASAVAAIIGVFIVMFSTVIKMQGLNIHHLLICYVMYMGCFGTTTDVAIESVYSDKSVIQKDNVPYGPAVIGSIISTIGYGLTQKMEVAFSDTSPLTEGKGSDGGYANPLYLINNLANWTENGQMLKEIESTNAGRQFARNYMTYVKECTTKAIYLGPTYSGKTFDEVFNLPQNDDIAFQSDLYSTELIDPSTGRATSYTCKDGINVIKNQFSMALAEFASDDEKLIALYQKIGKCTTTDECRAIISLGDLFDSTRDNLENLRLGQYTAQSLMYAGLTNSLKKTGLAYGYAHYKDQQAATMLFQAVQQRNVQWASEANMFLNSFKPMMAFMEGFFYAISPFAAIIMLLGLFGLNIFFKYLMLLIWIQLWMPIMAIANMFIVTSARELLYNEGVAATAKAGSNLSSISTYMYEDLVAVTQDKIAVASIMLASTPVLALMLMTGSVYAFTSLTGKLAGADHANEKLVSPDVVSPASYMSMQSTALADSTKYTMSGMAENSLNLASGISAGAQSSMQNMSSLTNSLSTSIQSGLLQAGALNSAHGLTGAIQHMENGSHSNDWATAVNRVETATAGSDYSVTGSAASRVTMALSAAMGGFSGNAASTFGLDARETRAFKELLSNGSALTASDKASIVQTVASGLTDSYGTNESFIKQGSLNETVSDQAQNLLSATRAHDEFTKAQRSLGNGTQLTDAEVIANSRQATGSLDTANRALGEAVQSLNSTEKGMFDSAYRDLTNKLGGKLGSDEEQRIQLRALNAVNSEKAALAAAKIANSAGLGGNTDYAEGAYKSAHANTVPNATGVNGSVAQRITNEASATMSQAQGLATEKTAQQQNTAGNAEVGNMQQDAENKYKKDLADVQAKQGRSVADLHKENYQQQDKSSFNSSGRSLGDRDYQVSAAENGGFNNLYEANENKAYSESFRDFDRNKGVGTQSPMVSAAHQAFSAGMALKSVTNAADLSLGAGKIDQATHDRLIGDAQTKYNQAMNYFDRTVDNHSHEIGTDKTGYANAQHNLLIEAMENGDHSIYTDQFNDRGLTGKLADGIKDLF